MKKLLFEMTAVVVLVASTVSAHQGATGVVLERMESMTELSNAVRTLAQMFDGKIARDHGVVRNAALVIEANSGENITHLFPLGSSGHPSEALEIVWSEWEEFSRLASRLQRAAKILEMTAAYEFTESEVDVIGLRRILGSKQPLDAAVVNSFSARSVFVEINKTCKACHDKFRQ